MLKGRTFIIRRDKNLLTIRIIHPNFWWTKKEKEKIRNGYHVCWYRARSSRSVWDVELKWELCGEAKELGQNKVYRIDTVILLFFKARQPASGWMSETVRGWANSWRLLATPIAIGVATKKNGKRTSQNEKIILSQLLSSVSRQVLFWKEN